MNGCIRIASGLVASAALVAAVASCDQGVRGRIAEQESLFAGLQGDVPSPEDAVRLAFDPANPAARYRGINFLANAPFGGEDLYVRLYETRIQDEEEEEAVRAICARALGRHGEPHHVELILPLLDSERNDVAIEAVGALQRLHNNAAVTPLITQLDQSTQPDADIRAEAADALGQYPTDRVFQALVRALDDERLSVTGRALQSLRTLTGQDFSDDRRVWIQWRDETSDPFAGQLPYQYPVFQRDRTWLDLIPFSRPAENEVPAAPIGMPQPSNAASRSGEVARENDPA